MCLLCTRAHMLHERLRAAHCCLHACVCVRDRVRVRACVCTQGTAVIRSSCAEGIRVLMQVTARIIWPAWAPHTLMKG